MATLCAHCGEELPRDDARFCAHCGMEWPAHSAHSSSSADADSKPSLDEAPPEDVQAATQNLKEQASLHEKQQPGIEQPPAWMQGLQRERRSEQSPIKQQSASSMRPLRVKVWDGAGSLHSQPESKGPVLSSGDDQRARIENKQSLYSSVQEEQPIEDLPTRLMESMPQVPLENAAIDDVPTNPVLALPNELQAAPEQHTSVQFQQNPTSNGDISHVSTVHLQTQQQGQVTPLPSVSLRDNHAAGPISSPAFPTRSRKRLPLLIGSSAVVLLLVLALGSWLVFVQPFRVSPATDTEQSFTDAKLGISLRYPSGWKKPLVDYHKQTITLQDGSDTAQMNISMANASTGSLESYLQKQVAQLGISNAKVGTPLSFGGASWENTKGDVQVKGAEYTYGVFTTPHSNHFYMLTQLAPRSIYADEEKLVFAPTRLSWHFL